MSYNHPLELNTLKRIFAIVYFFICISPFVFSQDLGERIDLSETKAAKGLKFSICSPKGWLVKEPKNPNVAVEFVNQSTGDNFNITVTHGATFISKKEFLKIKDDLIAENERLLKEQFTTLIGCEEEIVTIDDYPFIKFTATGFFFLNSTGLTTCRITMFIGCIEDLTLTLNGMEFDYIYSDKRIPRLYERVARSLSLYEQYDYVNSGRP